jgi:outer membrane receptor protein involved in Fe transport
MLTMLLALAVAVPVDGVVHDRQGTPVPAAEVTLTAGARRATTTTDSDGSFHLSWDGPARAVLTVTARDLASHRQDLRLDPPPSALTIVLWPALSEHITVTASRRNERLGESAASVAVVSAPEIEASGAVALDDAARQVPGFSLFRRTGSRYANPTAQGAFLRGLGGSGASRVLVLDDGIPLNDPFGGWIYWGRVPRAAVDRIEVLRGGASSLYGSGALAGVLQILRHGDQPYLNVEGSYGSLRTYDGTLYGQQALGRRTLRFSLESFGTDGYVNVDPAQRGRVDEPIDSQRQGGDVALEQPTGDAGRAFLRGSIYHEKRHNGTPLQHNDATVGQISLGLDRPLASGLLGLRAYGTDETAHQTFSSITVNRASETLTRSQHVPASALGFGAQWTGLRGRHALVAGADATGLWGRNEETIFTATGSTPSLADARQTLLGAFVEDTWQIDRRFSLRGAARLDSWSNVPRRGITDATGALLPSRSDTALSPRAALVYRAAARVSLSASAYGAFRAPTLNELYRSFRVGNVLTLANPELKAERLAGYEAGVLWSPTAGLSLRSALYSMDVKDTALNVTLSTTPALITRQRKSLGKIRSRGLELEAEGRAGPVAFTAGALFADATVRSSPSDPTLVGLRLPQVPRNQYSLQARGGFGPVSLALTARRWGSQFEDDQNRLPLAAATTVDAWGACNVFHAFEVFAVVENVADEAVQVGRTPVLTLGAPRTFRAGLRLRLRSGRPPAAEASARDVL